jgi:hypothetical protein
VFRHAPKIFVGRQQLEMMPNAQLGDESIGRSDLGSLAATSVSQPCGFDVIVQVSSDDREQGE